MKNKIVLCPMFYVLSRWFVVFVLLLTSDLGLRTSDFLYSQAPPGFTVYFNDPTGSADANSPGLDFRFKEFLDSASNKTIFAAFYDIDNSTAIAALNSAMSRSCTVYFLCDSDVAIAADFANLSTPYKVRTSSGSQVHNKFCVIANTTTFSGAKVWTGSWNATNNDTFQNNNNVIIIESSELSRYYFEEFWHMWNNGGGGTVGTAKSLTANNGKTVIVKDVTLKLYFSPYSSPSRTNSAIINEIYGSGSITGANKELHFAMFDFSDDTLGDNVKALYEKSVKVVGIFDAEQAGSGTEYTKLLTAGCEVVMDGNLYNLHSKFCIVDPGFANSKVITGSHNWSNNANTINDENTLVIYSTGIAKVYYQEFLKLYKKAKPAKGGRDEKAVFDIIVYPSPANYLTTIGFNISSMVNSAKVKIYTMFGDLVKEISPSITPGLYNETTWDLTNDAGDKIATGLYIIKVEVSTPDGTFFSKKKMAVVRK